MSTSPRPCQSCGSLTHTPTDTLSRGGPVYCPNCLDGMGTFRTVVIPSIIRAEPVKAEPAPEPAPFDYARLRRILDTWEAGGDLDAPCPACGADPDEGESSPETCPACHTRTAAWEARSAFYTPEFSATRLAVALIDLYTRTEGKTR